MLTVGEFRSEAGEIHLMFQSSKQVLKKVSYLTKVVQPIKKDSAD